MPDSFINVRNAQNWVNHHENVTVPVAKILTVRNEAADDAGSLNGMMATAARLQRIIREALTAGARIRAVGSHWSFSDIPAVAGGWIVETGKLGWRFTFGANDLHPQAQVTHDELLLCQCGTLIARINETLEAPNSVHPNAQRRRALRTSGASNGQTIAGALGTGVHGSAIDVAGMESQVVGIQLLTANRNMWIERASAPAMRDSFAARLGAELVRDDNLFEAAIVSLGSLGIIHSVMICSTGRYLLNTSVRRIRYERIKTALNSLDFRGTGISDESRRPYFFQAIIDPDDLWEDGDRAKVFCTVRYKETCEPNRPVKYKSKKENTDGTDLPKLIGDIIDLSPVFRDLATWLLLEIMMREQDQENEPDKWRTPGQVYTFTEARRGVASSGFAVPISQTTAALQIMAAAFRSYRDAGVVLTCRYVQKSPGILSFTRYDPTCVIDIDGIDSDETQALIKLVARRLSEAGMPYTMHWGKTNHLTKARVRAAYGGNVDRWNAARRQLLPDQAERNAFSSDFIDAVGLNA
jgi:D-arabinono-1,4-lactone oxidase